MSIRALIVDDEPLARERIRMLLADEPEIEVLAESANGTEALRDIQRLVPDLVFLDVQMPELTGFEVLDRLDPARMPVIIFVTAYDQYALKAFEVCALDYLLKPFDRERFGRALARARVELDRKKSGQVNERVLKLLSELGQAKKHLEKLMIRDGGRVFFLRADEIDWIEAAGNYVRLHVGKRRTSVPRDHDEARGSVKSGTLRAHPSIRDRQYGTYQRTAAVVPRRLRDRSSR